ncbi:hypothetical protein [Paracoccus versutus]|uniref:hypothetical protein n=1 Tax=Paracoccus versutus TaxID=34007 RepID=UPI000DF7473B|nr:hypothetical protein [Paracoccus versutus]RDD72738.1 hypothetical protein DVR11_04135 [Paracoccus versutus]
MDLNATPGKGPAVQPILAALAEVGAVLGVQRSARHLLAYFREHWLCATLSQFCLSFEIDALVVGKFLLHEII